LSQFRNFLYALAARSAQLLNMTDLARDLGIAVNTAKAWLSVLEATFQVIVLRPYFANVSKRLVKTPKVYFTEFGDSSLEFTLHAYLPQLSDRLPTIDEIHRAVFNALREHGIEIPFPQRDLHIRTGWPEAQNSQPDQQQDERGEEADVPNNS